MKHSKKIYVAISDDKLILRKMGVREKPYPGIFYEVFGSAFFIIEKSCRFYSFPELTKLKFPMS